MTINLSDNSPRVSYNVAAGVSQSAFVVSFEFFDNDDLNVYVDGTLKTITTDYTVTGGDGSTGTVTFVSAVVGASGGSTVVITRDIDLDRTTDFPSSGPFNIASLNTELDRFVAIAADLKDQADRALQLTDFDAAASLTLPEVDDRKGKTLAFNASTGAVEAGPSISDVQTVSAAAADIATLADIEDGTDATDAIQTVAGISSDVSTVSGISGNVTTVAGITSNIASVVADEADIGTVASNISNVNTVAGISSNVTTVAGISANVTTVAGKASFITADFAADLNTLATADIVSDLNTLATSAIVTDLDALADLVSEITSLGAITSDLSTVAGISSNVTTVAGNNSNVTTVAGISSNVTTVAGISSDVSTVAAANANITTVANANSNISTVASNIADVNNFADTYAISATAPSSPTLGDLWFDTTNNVMKVYGSGGFVNAGSNVNGTANRYNYVVGTSDGDYDGSTTVFPATYEAGYVDVYLNGAKLVVTSDFTATNGTSVTLGTAANSGDVIDIVGYGTFTATTALSLGDNEKVQFGAANDLQIYHDGTDSVIKDKGTGNLVVTSNGGGIFFRNDAETETYANFNNNGSVQLRYDNATKFETTSTGIDVTGTVTADGLTVDGNANVDGALTFTNQGVVNAYINSEEGFYFNVDSNNDQSTERVIQFGANAADSSGKKIALFKEGGDISFYEDTGTTAKFFWDASAESLGIGTSSPNADLHISSQLPDIRLTDSDASSEARISYNTAGNNGLIISSDEGNTAASSVMAFRVDGSEAMRIDSSGNLLVGKTSSSLSTAGAELRSGGAITGTVSNGVVAALNRLTNDGNILTFNKDGTTVGSIGSENGADLTIGNGDTGLRFSASGDSVRPFNMSTVANRDNAVNLGDSSTRFKDLYLSGGVYLGGTGSANKLDDYEEGSGSFSSVTDSSDTALSTATNNFYYTKIGNLVLLQIRVLLVSATTGEVRLNGVPFNIASSDSELGVVIDRRVFAYNATQIRLRAGTSNIYMYGVVTYRTDT